MSLHSNVTTKMTNGNPNGVRYFEDILQETGWGLYNKLVLLFSLTSAFCSSVALTSITFALPVAVCDIKLTKNNLLWIDAIIQFGMSIGAVSFAIVSDIMTRKFVLSSSLILIFISSFACGFCYEFFMFLFFTFLVGASATANYAFIKLNLSEIVPMKTRGYYLIMVDLFWVFGYIVSSSINWAMRCSVADEYMDHYTSWRMIYGFAPILCVLCICLHGVLQPSPRLLLSTNRKLEAHLVLKYIFSINNSNHSDNFPVALTTITHIIQEVGINRQYNIRSCREQCIQAKHRIGKILQKLLDRKSIYIICLTTIAKSSLFGGFSMVNIWLTKSLHLDIVNCNLNVTYLLHLSNIDLSSKCSYLIPATIFRDYILLASSAFVALLLFSYLVDRIGRHMPLSILLTVSGIASFNFIFITEFHYRYILAVACMIGFALSNSILDIIILENLPTCTRSTGLAITLFFPHIEAFFFRLFYKSECSIFYYMIGAIFVAVGVVGYFLPDRKRKPMRE